MRVMVDLSPVNTQGDSCLGLRATATGAASGFVRDTHLGVWVAIGNAEKGHKGAVGPDRVGIGQVLEMIVPAHWRRPVRAWGFSPESVLMGNRRHWGAWAR